MGLVTLLIAALAFLAGLAIGTWIEHYQARKPGHYDL